jgi:ribosomal protein S18 acetylase RimI-like enzyme
MENILTDVSDAALVTAIRANLCDFFRLLSRGDPAEHFETKRFTRWYSAAPHPWFTGALSSDHPKAGDEAFVAEVIEHFRQKGVNTFTWWLEPHLRPSDWESVLSAHGFGFSDDTPGMAVDLQTLNQALPAVDGLEIHTVTDAESLHTWIKVFIYGYGLPPAWESMVYEMYLKLGLDLPARNYLGYLNGKPVSTSSLFLGGGAAGIYSVATLPEARGKGLGAALTLQPLLDAREMGYHAGVLQSSDMGFNIYKKLGFRHLCQIENFYLVIR